MEWGGADRNRVSNVAESDSHTSHADQTDHGWKAIPEAHSFHISVVTQNQDVRAEL